MPLYKYKGINERGEKIEGTQSANDKNEVLAILRSNYYYPVEIEEVLQSKDIKELRFFTSIKIKDIAVFCRQLYTLLNAGVTIINCLDILKNQSENKSLKKGLEHVYDDIQKGLTFSEALKKQKKIFPTLLINMMEVGEISGNLDEITGRMATYYEKENKIYSKVKGAMVYPIILSIVSTSVIIFLLTFVMPTFVSMFESSGVALPLPTRILLGISNGIINHWYVLIVIFVVLVYTIKKWTYVEKSRFLIDKLKLKIPIIKNATKKVITSRFSRTLSILISSGVPLISALEIVSQVVGNKMVEEGIEKAKEEVIKGVSLAEPIQKIGIFPPMVISMIKTGEESGLLDEILDRTANFYDDEVEAAMQKLTTLLEPLMIVLMAIIVGFIVMAMVLPMFDMINTIQL